jgi:hypothetical protein
MDWNQRNPSPRPQKETARAPNSTAKWRSGGIKKRKIKKFRVAGKSRKTGEKWKAGRRAERNPEQRRGTQNEQKGDGGTQKGRGSASRSKDKKAHRAENGKAPGGRKQAKERASPVYPKPEGLKLEDGASALRHEIGIRGWRT